MNYKFELLLLNYVTQNFQGQIDILGTNAVVGHRPEPAWPYPQQSDSLLIELCNKLLSRQSFADKLEINDIRLHLSRLNGQPWYISYSFSQTPSIRMVLRYSIDHFF